MAELSTYEMSRCHDTSVYILAQQLPKSANSKARWEKCPSYNICLIGRNSKRKKKIGKLSIDLRACHDTVHMKTHEERACFPLRQTFLKFR